MANELKITGQLPGEGIAIAIFEYAKVHRETMAPEIRERYDRVQIQMLEDWVKFWRKFLELEQ